MESGRDEPEGQARAIGAAIGRHLPAGECGNLTTDLPRSGRHAGAHKNFPKFLIGVFLAACSASSSAESEIST
jgi:hypothetical protein